MRIWRSGPIQLVLLASAGFVLTKAAVEYVSPPDEPKGDVVQEDVTLVEPGKCPDVGLNPDGSGVRTYSPEYCAQAEQEARAEFEKTAPLYAYREDCIAQHGEDACRGDVKVVERDGQSQAGYMPAFGGFLVGTAAALAAAHVFHTLQGNATGRISRPIPIYQTVSNTCRTNPNDPSCRSGGTGGSGGGGRTGSNGYSYSYNGYEVAKPNADGKTTTTVRKTASGRYGPYTRAPSTYAGAISTRATGGTSGASAGTTAKAGSSVGVTARGGFGGSAAAHASGGHGGGGHGGGGG